MSVKYRVRGTITERETGRPILGLIVRAYDKDLIFDDALGFATTDEEGKFSIRFDEEDFRDAFESKPDVFLRIYDAQGSREIHNTRDAIRRNAGTDEVFELEVSGNLLESY